MGTYTGGLRFLFVPTVGMPHNVMRDGTFVFAKRVIDDLTAKGHFVYVVLPEECRNSLKDENSRVMYLYSSIPVLVYDILTSIVDTALLAENFSPKIGKYMIDAVITWSSEHALHIASALSAHTQFGRLPIFFVEQAVDWWDSNPMYTDDFTGQGIKCVGGIYTRPIFLAPREKKMWMEKARYYGLSAMHRAMIDENSVVCGVPVDRQKIESVKGLLPKPKQVQLLFAARTNATKHPEKIVNVFDTVYKSGLPVKVKYLTLTSEIGCSAYVEKWQIFKGREYLKPEFSAGVDRFYEEAAKSHVFVSWSDSESFPVSLAEASFFDMVLVLGIQPGKNNWAREFFPEGVMPEKYYVKTEAEATELVAWISQNYEQALEEQKLVKAFFEEWTGGHRISDHVEQKTRSHVTNGAASGFYAPSGFQGLLDELAPFFAEKGPEPFANLLALLQNKARAWKPDNMVRASTRRFPSDFDLHGLWRAKYGFIDTCEKRYPIYVRGPCHSRA